MGCGGECEVAWVCGGLSVSGVCISSSIHSGFLAYPAWARIPTIDPIVYTTIDAIKYKSDYVYFLKTSILVDLL